MRLPIAAAVAVLLALPAAADPVLGRWKTQPDDNGNFGIVEFAACGEKLCATLRESFDGSGKKIASANIGRAIVWDMAPKGNGAYGGGSIWSPDRDQTYASKMTLSGDSLSVSGCILIICRAQEWSRVK
ncbi:MAG: hypothetical protein RLZ26_840 [Pseudomonadota bacterium]